MNNQKFPDRAIILIRGLPGSGKSTLARVLADPGKDPVYSVDDYFTDPVSGDYRFQFDKNHLAYRQCEQRVKEAVEKELPRIFVDNTFTMEWEMEPYFRIAATSGYSIFVITVENRHQGENIHGVSREQLEKMAAGFRVKLTGF